VAREARGEGSEFEFGGYVYTIPGRDDWPIDVVEALEDEKMLKAAASLLGPAQWGAFKQRHRVGDVEAFFVAFGEALGADPTR
jgi:hypothetical protein